MAFNISNFLDQISGNDWARTDKFDVTFSPPQSVISIVNPQNLTYQCYSAILPGIEVNTIEYKHNVVTRRMPQKRTYPSAQLSFYVTSDMSIKGLMDAWVNSCITQIDDNNATNDSLIRYKMNSEGLPNYEGSIMIQQYDVTGVPTYGVLLNEAFPILVSDMPLDWKEDAVHRLTVTFNFWQWAPTWNNPVATAKSSFMTPLTQINPNSL